MKPIGSASRKTTKTVKSHLRSFLLFVASWGMLIWGIVVLIRLSLTVFQSNDTIGLSLLGGLIFVAYILVRKEIQRW